VKLHIRKAKKRDLPSIYKLVAELAKYEKAEDQLTATLDDYTNDFEKGSFECIVAEKVDSIIGMALYYGTYSTWKGRMLYLEDFVVEEKYRGSGVGKMIFSKLLEEARRKEYRLIKWQVLEWNEPAINFYEKYEVHTDKEWWNMKIFLNS